ncbi:MAG: hypothetical protein KDA27_11480 [Candidatus Eisenbacteria bacterium]|uniref:Right handed beta helix domain-containing protein n=1 Tax=Eiseniibacteriota bacterium TaxID=2212470 RepID=A0A956SFK8_UNCEI|nr:hypothetical protein [Candidatus Eisenbacteria bacterium]MCB9465909.1 hypothetical protein [Candidatus Eisenbacteria bacterium]
MRTVIALFLIGVSVLALRDAPAAVLGVPGDFLTIQEALDASDDGDVVLVEPGLHVAPYPSFDFGGRRVTLRSVAGPEVTILEPNENGILFWLRSGETLDTRIEGFTMRAVSQLFDGPYGLAILVDGAACTAQDCVIVGNESGGLVRSGAGVGVIGGAFRMRGSTIAANDSHSDGADYGGLYVLGGADVVLERCIVDANCQKNILVGSGSLTLDCCIVGGQIDVNEQMGTITYVNPVEGDPLFCDPPPCGDLDADPVGLRVDADSPALPGNNECGVLIGALGVGCPTTNAPYDVGDASVLRLTGPWPNPSASGFEFEVGVEREAEVRVALFDSQGRLVDTVFNGVLAAGTHHLGHEWEGRSAEAPRTLWLRVWVDGASTGSTTARRVVRLN